MKRKTAIDLANDGVSSRLLVCQDDDAYQQRVTRFASMLSWLARTTINHIPFRNKLHSRVQHA